MSELPIVDVGPLAHGGHCVARLDGQVVFVRHAIPGERVRVRITERRRKYLRADAVEIIDAADNRVSPPCPYVGRCGGCDFQHMDSGHQRRLLGGVVAEQLRRLAGLEMDVRVEAVHPDDFGWRTRMTFAVDDAGRPGLRAYRSHAVVPVDSCAIASNQLPDVLSHTWPDGPIGAVVSAEHDRVVIADFDESSMPPIDADGHVTHDGKAVRGRDTLQERVHDTNFEVSATAFWQVHPRAAETLVDAVLQGVDPAEGERIADLYAGVGLFSVFLAGEVGTAGRVFSVESDSIAAADAQRNLAQFPQATAVSKPVDRALAAGLCGESLDAVVLDPPRSGAKTAIAGIASLRPSRIVYVACDPAALARDIAALAHHGYELSGIRGFQLFPMTHHVECVAVLVRAGARRDSFACPAEDSW